MKNAYDEIVALRKELKRPGVFQRNQIQLRMLAWDITIGGSLIFKRFMDIVMTVVCVILGSPVFLLTAILVKVTSPGPEGATTSATTIGQRNREGFPPNYYQR